MNNAALFAKYLAKLITYPAPCKVVKRVHQGYVMLNPDSTLFYNPGLTGEVKIYYNQEFLLNIKTIDIYHDYLIPPFEPSKLEHGLSVWLNPTAGMTNVRSLALYPSKRGFIRSCKFTKTLEDYFRYTTAVKDLTSILLTNTVKQKLENHRIAING